MPNSHEHSIAGCLTGMTVMGIWELISQSNSIQRNPSLKIDWGVVIGKIAAGAVVGTVAGILPDVLEPATNPHHRQFFHSKTAAGLASVGLWKVGVSNINIDKKQIIACAIAGVLSHYYKDSQTVLGLPNY